MSWSFSVQWIEMRGGCSFQWYWSLFKHSFHNMHITMGLGCGTYELIILTSGLLWCSCLGSLFSLFFCFTFVFLSIRYGNMDPTGNIGWTNTGTIEALLNDKKIVLDTKIHYSIKRFFSGVHAYVSGADALTHCINVLRTSMQSLWVHWHRLHMHELLKRTVSYL
jgi:hypothetical protein